MKSSSVQPLPPGDLADDVFTRSHLYIALKLSTHLVLYPNHAWQFMCIMPLAALGKVGRYRACPQPSRSLAAAGCREAFVPVLVRTLPRPCPRGAAVGPTGVPVPIRRQSSPSDCAYFGVYSSWWFSSDFQCS